MQIPILSGNFSDTTGELRVAYPVNYYPIAVQTGVSSGYLRPADGIVQFATGTGLDRGGINWNGQHIRVTGTDLVSISSTGVVTVLASGITGADRARFDYSFDRLAIAADKKLWYWNGTLTQVTDPNLLNVNSMLWVDGYFMTTDGQYLIVTELTDPTVVNPLKYGSSEADPDPVECLLKLRNEVYALNRNTIEIFQNVGGAYFPFQRINGAVTPRGTLGPHTACVYNEAIAFIGGGRNESIAVWMSINAQSQKISTREIDMRLATYPEAVLSQAVVEAQVTDSQNLLYIHLPDQTLVYDAIASAMLQTQVWFILSSGMAGLSQFRGRNLVYVYDTWTCGDPQSSAIGYMTDQTGDHWGNRVEWVIQTGVFYNQSLGAIFHQLELVALNGLGVFGANPTVWTSFSNDGLNWSAERSKLTGQSGATTKRLVWFNQGFMRNWRVQRFRGLSDSHLIFIRLEARLEGLNA